MPTCPMCAEAVPAGAAKCEQCGHSLREAPAPRADGQSTYDVMQDKVGLVPNVRLKDNLMQAAATGIGVLLGVVIGGLAGGGQGALVGALVGLIIGGLGSGFVLMIMGLMRR